MLVITDKESIELPFISPICTVTTTKFSPSVINEIKTLTNFKTLSPEAIDFMFVFKLDYLLFNYELRYTTENPYVKEIKIIKHETNATIKLHKLLKRFRGYEEFLDFSFLTEVDLDLVISLKLLNVLEYLHTNNILWSISPLVDEASRYGHLEVIEWFYYNTNFDYTYLAIDNATENGYLQVIEWFYKNTKFKYKNAVQIAISKNYLEIVSWFQLNDLF